MMRRSWRRLIASAGVLTASLAVMVLAGAGSDSASAAHQSPARAPATQVSPPAPLAPRDTIRFAGSVHRGETYRRSIGHGLEFRLTPMRGVSDGAWDIGIWPPDSVEIDYASVATPPYRGINSRNIEGWHFRNQNNTGPNLGDVNAPQEERGFLFVESRAAFDSSFAALERVMWSYNYSDAVADHASEMLDSLSTGTGTLRITSLSLTPSKPGARAEIDSMRFDVTLVATRGKR